MTIKETSKNLRPYEKCITYGPEILSDEELLAIIIRSGTKDEDSVSLSKRVLSKGNLENGILNIVNLSIDELTQIKGIGKVKAIQIKCIAELSKRIAAQSRSLNNKLVTPADVAQYCMESLRHLKYEKTIVIMVDSACRYLGEYEVSKGTVNTSLASPREIFIEAIRKEAVGIILVHNHPSGDPNPSYDDIKLTNKIYEAGKLIDIKVLDHIVIGDNRFISFNENNLIFNNDNSDSSSALDDES